MVDSLPEIEGKYEILGKLQVGGMGAIYKVRHRLLGDERVVKVLRPQLVHDVAFQKRFHREARAATRLTHPNIARLYDFSVDDTGAAYIVMEYIEGWSLEHLVTRGELTPLGLALEIARQSLRAIGHLHSHGVIHRDISPDNLMLTRDVDGKAAVKLIDLGLAKSVTRAEELITASGMFVGKFRYAAPEHFQRESAVPAGPPSDLYSFGLVLYELLTGRYPIRGKSATSLMAGHLYHAPLDFDETDLAQRVPAELRQVVLRSLAKSPEARFASAEEFSSALEPIRQRFGVDTPETRYLLELIQRPPHEERRRQPSPGSTQSRLDRQFSAQPTPPPRASSSPTSSPSPLSTPSLSPSDLEAAWVGRIEAKIAEGDLGAAREELRRALEAEETAELRELGERIDEMEQIEIRRHVEQGLDEVERLRGRGELEAALKKARQLHDGAAQHKLVRLVVREIEGELAGGLKPSPKTREEPEEVDEAAIATTTPFHVTYPARTEPFDEAAMAQTDILPQVPAGTADGGDLRTQVAERPARDVSTGSERPSPAPASEHTRAEPQPTEPVPVIPLDEPPPSGSPRAAPSVTPSAAVELPRVPPQVEPSPIELSPIEPPAAEPLLSPPAPEERWGADLLEPSPSPQGTLERGFDEISLQTIPQPRDEPAAAPDLLLGSATPQDWFEPEPAPPEPGPDLLIESVAEPGDALDNLTLSMGADGEVAWQGPPRGDLPGTRSSRRLFMTALLLVVVFLLIGIGLARLSSRTEAPREVLRDEEVASPRLSRGEAVIEARPWAQVMRIVDANGRERPLPPSARTPVTFELDAGTYQVTLFHPPTNTTAVVEVRVVVGEQTRISHIIAP